MNETTAHIFQCTDRNEVHLEHHWKLMALLAEQQLPNGLLRLIEVGIDLALQSDNTHQGEHWDGDDDGNEVKKRVAQLLNGNEINTEYKDAFRQQTVIGWEYIFTGMAKMLDRATAMCDEICNSDDDMGQSVLVQQEQNTIQREKQQQFNTMEETVSGGESVEASDTNRTTGRRC